MLELCNIPFPKSDQGKNQYVRNCQHSHVFEEKKLYIFRFVRNELLTKHLPRVVNKICVCHEK